MAKNTAKANQMRDDLARDTPSREYRAVSRYLSKLKFAPRLMGVDAVDVWRKMEKLCELYEDAIDAERARADKAEKALQQIYARARAASVRNEQNNAGVSAETAEPLAESAPQEGQSHG